VTTNNGVVTASIVLPEGVKKAVITIPAASVTPGTVAVNAETGEIIILSVPTEGGVAVVVDSNVTVKLVDRSASFEDVPSGYWGADGIAFATAHDLFNGTSATTFTPGGDMTRQMLMTVLARLDGVDTSTGSTWYEAGMAWAVENNISDGTNGEASVTREQLVTMLWRYAGSPAVTGSLAGFADADSVSAYAKDAMTWAVASGIVSGSNGNLDPQGNASRAQVAAMINRYVSAIVIEKGRVI
jgi:hypothetical protein